MTSKLPVAPRRCPGGRWGRLQRAWLPQRRNHRGVPHRFEVLQRPAPELDWDLGLRDSHTAPRYPVRGQRPSPLLLPGSCTPPAVEVSRGPLGDSGGRWSGRLGFWTGSTRGGQPTARKVRNIRRGGQPCRGGAPLRGPRCPVLHLRPEPFYRGDRSSPHRATGARSPTGQGGNVSVTLPRPAVQIVRSEIGPAAFREGPRSASGPAG
jgi:hypothetical protein